MTVNNTTHATVNGFRELKDLLGLGPDHLERLRGRAQFFIDGGHYERALIMLEMLEALDRNDTLPTLLAIDSLLALGRSDGAEAKARALLARDPDDGDALVALAEVQIAVGDLVPAAATLERVVTRDPDGVTEAGRRALAVAAAAYERLATA